MTINIGGHTFTQEEVIAAIAASDNQTATVSSYSSLEEVGGVLQAVLHRLAALEDRLPITRQGFGVITTPGTDKTTYRVQTTDRNGDLMFVTFELPNA